MNLLRSRIYWVSYSLVHNAGASINHFGGDQDFLTEDTGTSFGFYVTVNSDLFPVRGNFSFHSVDNDKYEFWYESGTPYVTCRTTEWWFSGNFEHTKQRRVRKCEDNYKHENVTGVFHCSDLVSTCELVVNCGRFEVAGVAKHTAGIVRLCDS